MLVVWLIQTLKEKYWSLSQLFLIYWRLAVGRWMEAFEWAHLEEVWDLSKEFLFIFWMIDLSTLKFYLKHLLVKIRAEEKIFKFKMVE